MAGQLVRQLNHSLMFKAFESVRTTKSNLPKLKEIGDLSEHSRRFIANRNDIEKFAQDIRVIVQELVYVGVIAGDATTKS